MVQRELALFVATFTTLLAIINPLEVLPIYLKLLAGTDLRARRAVRTALHIVAETRAASVTRRRVFMRVAARRCRMCCGRVSTLMARRMR